MRGARSEATTGGSSKVTAKTKPNVSFSLSLASIATSFLVAGPRYLVSLPFGIRRRRSWTTWSRPAVPSWGKVVEVRIDEERRKEGWSISPSFRSQPLARRFAPDPAHPRTSWKEALGRDHRRYLCLRFDDCILLLLYHRKHLSGFRL